MRRYTLNYFSRRPPFIASRVSTGHKGPAIADRHSLFWTKKFPVLRLREFVRNPLIFLGLQQSPAAFCAAFLRNSLLFSLLAGNLAVETGSPGLLPPPRICMFLPAFRVFHELPRNQRPSSGTGASPGLWRPKSGPTWRRTRLRLRPCEFVSWRSDASTARDRFALCAETGSQIRRWAWNAPSAVPCEARNSNWTMDCAGCQRRLCVASTNADTAGICATH